MNRLQLSEIDEVETIEKESFTIRDKNQATWALRKIRALKAQTKETNELAEMEIERIKAWQAIENQSAEDSIAYFEGLLHDFMLGERAHDPKLKSIKLPHGTIKFRKQQPEYVRNEPALIEWAKQSDKTGLIKIKESLDWATMKKGITAADGKAIYNETGEVLEHVEIIEREDKFEVVTN